MCVGWQVSTQLPPNALGPGYQERIEAPKMPLTGCRGQPLTGGPHIIVHHLENSRSQRILWLLVSIWNPFLGKFYALTSPGCQEELELPYEIKRYNRTPSYTAPEEMKQVHPLGKSPIISDGSLTIAESGAIVGEQY